MNFGDVRRAQLAKSTLSPPRWCPWDLLRSTQVLKRLGAESKGNYRTYSITGNTAALVPEYAVEDLRSAELQARFLRLHWRNCPWSEHSDHDDDDGIYGKTNSLSKFFKITRQHFKFRHYFYSANIFEALFKSSWLSVLRYGEYIFTKDSQAIEFFVVVIVALLCKFWPTSKLCIYGYLPATSSASNVCF